MLFALTIVLASCGGDEPKRADAVRTGEEGTSELEGDAEAEASGRCASQDTIPLAAVESLLPIGLTLPDEATIIESVDEPTHVTVVGRLDASSGATPAALRKRYQDELEDAGYEITGGEDEGHESEVFFAFDDGRKGTVQSIKSSCPPDTVRVIVSYVKPAS